MVTQTMLATNFKGKVGFINTGVVGYPEEFLNSNMVAQTRLTAQYNNTAWFVFRKTCAHPEEGAEFRNPSWKITKL